MNIDLVALGSIIAVISSAAIVVFLAFKIKGLINKDAESHKR